MTNDKCCKHCNRSLPETVFHFSNRIAIDHGYCSFMCLKAGVGEDEAFTIISREYQRKNA